VIVSVQITGDRACYHASMIVPTMYSAAALGIFVCLGVQKFWVAAEPPPVWKCHWICTITTSTTGRRWWSGPQGSPPVAAPDCTAYCMLLETSV